MAESNGALPDGMAGLEGHGDGKVEMLIFPDNTRKQVIQRFKTPMLFISYELTNAVQVGKQMIDCAVACGAHVEIKVPRKEITREKKAALEARVLHIIRSTQEQGRKPGFVAKSVVEQILNAID